MFSQHLYKYIRDDVPAEAVPLLAVLGHVLLVVYRLHGLGLGHDRGAAQPVAALVLRLPLRHRPQRVRAEVAAARPGHGLVMVLTLLITLITSGPPCPAWSPPWRCPPSRGWG